MRHSSKALLLTAMMVCGGMAATCNTDEVKAKFSSGGWTASYGKRSWDGQTGLTVAAAAASALGGPATAAAAAEFLRRMIDEQLQGAARALGEAGGATAKDALNTLASNLLAGRDATVGLGTMDIKGAMIRVNCKNCMNVPCPTWRKPGRTCPKCVNSEGYYQLAVAFRPR